MNATATLGSGYATTQTRSKRGRIVHSRTFRVGEPGSWKRYERLDRMHYINKRKLGVFVAGRKAPYIVTFLEVRQVDSNGVGLGSERHATATPVLCGAIRCLADRPHTVDLYVNRSWRATDKWGATLNPGDGKGAIIAYGKTPIAAAANVRRAARQVEAI
jgi:hypothetical protein